MPIEPLTIETMIEEFYELRKYRREYPERVEVTPEVLGALKLEAVREKIGMVSLHVPVILNPDLPKPGWRIIFRPPHVLYNEDGIVIAAKSHLSRYEMLRVIEDEAEWVYEDISVLNDDDEYHLRLSEVRKLAEGFKHCWYRQADPANSDEMAGEWGIAGWWPCNEDHSWAVPYTETGLDR